MKTARMLVILVLAFGLSAEVANADFTFGTPTNLGPLVNSSVDDSAPSLSADGLSLFFHSARSGGYGSGDIWVTTRATTNDPWEEPVNLGPTVNSSYHYWAPCISADGLMLFFVSNQPGGYGSWDIWVTTRTTTDADWSAPVNLGPTVNSSAEEVFPRISPDGLQLYFSELEVFRPGGYGGSDMWVTTRDTASDPWGTPVNLGPTVNSSSHDDAPFITADGLALFFNSTRPGAYGLPDIFVTRRATTDDDWDTPMNLWPTVNISYGENTPRISADGSTLYFFSKRPGGVGDLDIWQAPILPVVDLNGDGIVDATDMCIMVDHWGTDEQLYDIGPMPWGDGIVDVQDLIVLAEHLFEVYPSAETVEVNEDNDGGQIELELDKLLVVTLASNPSTGYRWELVENNESILKQFGEVEFKSSQTGEPPMPGAGGWEIFRFKAISAGQITLKLVYHSLFEEGVEPINTFSIEVVVR